MRFLPSLALAGALALSACVDIDMTTTITGADSATVVGQMRMDRQMLDMMGGTDGFCPAEDGGTLTMTDTTAICDMNMAGSFDEVFTGGEGEPVPTAVDQGDGTVLVSFPIGQMATDAGEMRNDAQMAAMMRPMLEGRAFVLRIAGAEIIESNGEISEDGTSASYTFNLVDILDPNVQVPEAFVTLVRY